jgi:hypothetical protein
MQFPSPDRLMNVVYADSPAAIHDRGVARCRGRCRRAERRNCYSEDSKQPGSHSGSSLSTGDVAEVFGQEQAVW